MVLPWLYFYLKTPEVIHDCLQMDLDYTNLEIKQFIMTVQQDKSLLEQYESSHKQLAMAGKTDLLHQLHAALAYQGIFEKDHILQLFHYGAIARISELELAAVLEETFRKIVHALSTNFSENIEHFHYFLHLSDWRGYLEMLGSGLT